MNSVTTLIFVCFLIVNVHAPNPVCKFLKNIFKKELGVYSYGEKSLKELYCKISKMEFTNADEAFSQLKNEVDNSGNEDMKASFSCIKDQKLQCDSPLFTAECVAVKMYTTDFYESYNKEFRNDNLKKFMIYTSLLHSAVKKLSQQLTNVVTVYRGVSKAFKYGTSPFHFKQFTSTSLSKEVAKKFTETDDKLLKFEFDSNSLIAKVAMLSQSPLELEFLVSPFQAIKQDKDRKEEGYVVFKSYGDPESIFKCK